MLRADSGGPKGSQESNSGRLHIRLMPYSLCCLSGPTLVFFILALGPYLVMFRDYSCLSAQNSISVWGIIWGAAAGSKVNWVQSKCLPLCPISPVLGSLLSYV